MQRNYQLPQTRKEKVELLKSILAVELRISDLENGGYLITLWKEDLDPNFMITLDGSERATKEVAADRTIRHITLNLNSKGA